jgi:hypothetical protein
LSLRLVRIWLPIIVVAFGLGVWLVDPSVSSAEGAAGIVGAGIAIWIGNVLFRIGVKGDVERDDEEAARTFFDEHGHWPDEPPPPAGAGPRPRPRSTSGSDPRARRRPS